jgi:uncharacterized protein (TIGR02117 family)
MALGLLARLALVKESGAETSTSIPPGIATPTFDPMRSVCHLWFLLLSACSTIPHAVVQQKEAGPVRNQTIRVVSHGWHTGLIVPAAAAEQSLPFLKKRFHGARAYEFGWGDKGFYMADRITTTVTLKALFLADGSVMHVVALHADPAATFPMSPQTQLKISAKEMESLGCYLASSFKPDSQGRVQSLRYGLYGDSQFYEGVGRYHALNTCNKWTAKGLKSAGIHISTVFKLTSGSVMSAVSGDP